MGGLWAGACLVYASIAAWGTPPGVSEQASIIDLEDPFAFIRPRSERNLGLACTEYTECVDEVGVLIAYIPTLRNTHDRCFARDLLDIIRHIICMTSYPQKIIYSTTLYKLVRCAMLPQITE